ESLFLDSANYKNSSFLRKDIANASPIVSSDGQSEIEPPRQYSSKSTELVQHSSEFTDSDRYPSDKVTADYDSYASHHQIGQKIAVRNYGDIDASQNALLDDQPENEENYQFSSEFDRYSSNEETVVDSDSYTSRLQIEQILAARNYDEIIDLIKSDSLALIRLSNVVDKEFLLHLSESLIERYSGRKISHEIIEWAGKNLEKESVASLISMILNDDEYAPRILDSIRNDDSDLKRQLIEYYYSLFESRLPLFEADQEVREKRFHLEDAGLVLLAPFISTLFSRLGYLDENGCFESVASQFRAIILLKRVVFPEVVEIHDYELNLCKVLCGVNPAFPIPTDIQLGEDEKNEIDHLLESVIDYWTIINGTSTDGFRSSFLKRFGTLEKSENMWIVRVEGSTIDILMEDLPWSFSALSYSWCQDVIYVEWQKPL
ncbi:MAG: contractile injection system tape measure protein, partial [Paludibacteraceae bacterium]|nr:contractile injection system tape measure protein [Paludibacteraceae bacterium]